MKLLIRLMFSLLLSTTAFAGGHITESKTTEFQTGNRVVLVAGATGGTGRLVVEQLIAEGFEVRAMVRNLDKGKRVLGEKVKLVQADVTKPETLTAAVASTDYIISTIGTSIGAEGGNNPQTVDYQGVVALIDAAQAAGNKKFVLVTSGGTTWRFHPLNWLGDDVLKWKRKSEIHLRESGLNHVIVRPAGGLKDEPINSKSISFSQDDGIPSTISRINVAIVTVKALMFEESNNKTFEIEDHEDGQTTDEINWQQVFQKLKVTSDNF
ncbi:MAG: hypothetical protein ACJA0N_001483 [Pseudohongiellaceae bacterium]|jgi:uncharacterized protein YbjT (DUF2867 family)